jgi:hypothetical protein
MLTKEEQRAIYLANHPKYAKAIKKEEKNRERIEKNMLKRHLIGIRRSNNIKKLYKSGKSVYQIARRFKITYNQATHQIHKTNNTIFHNTT